MARVETWLDCDLKKLVKVQHLSGNLFSQDNQGNLVGTKVYSDGEAVTLEGTVSAEVIRPDGGTVTISSGTVEENRASVILPSAAYAYPGLETIVIKLTNSGVVTTLAAVTVIVYRSTTDTVVDPGTVILSIETLISTINTAVASIPADYSSLWTSLAPAFSTSVNYVAGQYVTYNGAVYRFTTAHTAGAWNSAHVAATNVGGEIYDLKSALGTIENNFYNPSQSIFTLTDISVGVWTNTGAYTNAIKWLCNTYLIPVRQGMIIHYSSSTLNFDFKLFDSKVSPASLLWESGFLSATTSSEMYIPYDGFLGILLRLGDGSTDLDLSDYDADISISGENAIYIQQNILGYYYPEQFTKPDETNYTNAILSAITAAGSGGTVVFKPGKTYPITGQIDITNEYVTLMSNADSMHFPIIKAIGTINTWMFHVKKEGAVFQNLVLEGNHAVSGILFDKRTGSGDTESVVDLDANIFGCKFRMLNYGAFALGRGVVFNNCYFVDCMIGIAFNSLSITDEGQTVYPKIRAWVVNNCIFHGLGQYKYNDMDPRVAPFVNIDTIKNYDCWGIRNYNSSAMQYDIKITNNYVDGYGYCGLYYGNPNGVMISGNQISKENPVSILAFLTNGLYSNMVQGSIMNNFVSATRNPIVASYAHDKTLGNSSPIFIDSTTQISIIGNSFFDYGGAGVYINKGHRIVINNNVFYGINLDDTDGAIHVTSDNNENVEKLAISFNTFFRYDSAEGTDNLINYTSFIDEELSKYNMTENITDNTL